MIASLIARFEPDANDLMATVAAIERQPGFEPGDLIGTHSLPLIIEAADAKDMEAQTRWLQTQTNVAFVDVVFVHLEQESAASPAAPITR